MSFAVSILALLAAAAGGALVLTSFPRAEPPTRCLSADPRASHRHLEEPWMPTIRYSLGFRHIILETADNLFYFDPAGGPEEFRALTTALRLDAERHQAATAKADAELARLSPDLVEALKTAWYAKHPPPTPRAPRLSLDELLGDSQ